MILKIDLQIESRNKFEGWHWRKKNRHSKVWESHIWAACNGKVPKAIGPMEVKIKSFRERLLDEDNLSGGCKGILDAMKRLGIIVNDDPKSVKVSYGQEIIRKRDKIKPHTLIEFEDVMKAGL